MPLASPPILMRRGEQTTGPTNAELQAMLARKKQIRQQLDHSQQVREEKWKCVRDSLQAHMPSTPSPPNVF